MKTCLLLFLVIITKFSVAQDSTALQKLQTQFREVYNNHKDPGANYFNRLYLASTVVLNLENDVFFEELTARKKKNKNIPNDSLAGEIFDQVMSWFTKNHLWDSNPDAPVKYKQAFTMYNERLCPCVTTKLLSKNYRIEQADIASCLALLAMDTSLANMLRREAGSSTVTELMNISQLAGVYVFEKCPALYQFFVEIPRDEVTSAANARITWFFHDADRKVIELYNAKSFAKLSSYFPSYKNYNQEILRIKEFLNKKEMISSFERKRLTTGKTEVIKTYYSDQNNKPTVHGQIIYVFSEENVEPFLVSVRFMPAEKIKNLKAILKKLEEEETLAPPEVLELQDTKIELIPVDTLLKKKGR